MQNIKVSRTCAAPHGGLLRAAQHIGTEPNVPVTKKRYNSLPTVARPPWSSTVLVKPRHRVQQLQIAVPSAKYGGWATAARVYSSLCRPLTSLSTLTPPSGDTTVRDDRGAARVDARRTHGRGQVFEPSRARGDIVAAEADGQRGTWRSLFHPYLSVPPLFLLACCVPWSQPALVFAAVCVKYNSVPCRYIGIGVVGVARAPLPGQAQSCGTSTETSFNSRC